MNTHALWQSQPLESPRISLQYIRRQAERLNSDIRKELRWGYLGTAMGVAALALFTFAPAPVWSMARVPAALHLLVQLTALLVLIGAAYHTFQVHRRGKLQLMTQQEQVMQSLQTYRIALERRRDHFLSAWRWSLWPLLPSVAVVLGGELLFDERPGKSVRLGLSAVVCATAFLLAAWVSWRKGREYQKELDALGTLE
ncbi:MAG TPA: hypothetical protein VHW95_11145 [Steroidobacteraceae bacterium]|jgi:hypothetical protein|nr:hypothetical protein [Steroidobacteraceae bacterium]